MEISFSKKFEQTNSSNQFIKNYQIPHRTIPIIVFILRSREGKGVVSSNFQSESRLISLKSLSQQRSVRVRVLSNRRFHNRLCTVRYLANDDRERHRGPFAYQKHRRFAW